MSKPAMQEKKPMTDSTRGLFGLPFAVRALPIVLVLVSLAGAYELLDRHVAARGWISTDNAFVAGNVVTLAAQANGTVVAVATDNTREVAAGEVLVRLDGVKAGLELDEARAALGETVRRVAGQFAEVERVQAAVHSTEAAISRLEQDLQRSRVAAGDDTVSLSQVRNAEDQLQQLRAGLAGAEADLAASRAQAGTTTVREHPAVRHAVATMLRRGLDVARSEIRAPVGGRVAKRKVQPGDVVQPGTPLLAIVPREQVWVDANFRETELEGLAVGQVAELEFDSTTGKQRLRGVVEGFNPGTGSVFALLPPENASGNFVHIVERLPVRIALDPKELAANPPPLGLSVKVRVRRGQPDAPPKASPVSLRTAIYTDELKAFEDEAEAIIERNLR